MKYDIFISYKRKGTSSATAAYLYELLQQKGYNVFFDRKEMRSGKFNEQILEHISNATDIIILLEKESLSSWFDYRTVKRSRSLGDKDSSGRLDSAVGFQEEPYKTDWFCKEIMHALSLEGKNIIPVLLDGYNMPEKKDLPPEMAELSLHQALPLDVSEADEFYEKYLIGQDYLKSKPANLSLTKRFQSKGGIVACFLLYTEVDSCDLYECGEKIATLTDNDDEWHPFRYPVNFAGEHRFRAINNDSCEIVTIRCSVETNCQQYVPIQFTDTQNLWQLTKAEIAAQNDAERLYNWGRGLFDGTTKHEPDIALSFECLQRAIDLGSQDALSFVASYGSGLITQKQASPEVAFKWYSIAAEQGNPDAFCCLANMFYDGDGVDQDYEKAFEWYRKAAEQGDVIGQFYLGTMYEDGNGVAQDYGKAFEWYQKCADQGDADGQRKLGYFFDESLGVERDYGKAFEWYEKSAKQGDSVGQYCLGTMYEDGHGVDQDYGKAFELYRKAAEQGNAYAQQRLGYFFEEGLGVGQDYGKAIEWYEKAAEQGIAYAQHKLGYFYGDGLGVDQDYGKAFEWFEKSAERGNATGQWLLGRMYEYGLGVDQNHGKAFELFEKSAEQGNATGLLWLGRMYEEGLGVEQDYGRAIEWYKKSAEQGNEYSLNPIAWVYHLMGKYDEALPWAEKAVDAAPDNPDYIDTLATVYEGLGRHEDALERFEECLRLYKENGDDEGVEETKQKIDALKKKMQRTGNRR